MTAPSIAAWHRQAKALKEAAVPRPPCSAIRRAIESLPPEGISWRSRRLWHPIGYAATALWMGAILAITREDADHPLFKLIFTVPLAGWILGIAAARLIRRLWPKAKLPEAERRRRP